MYDLEGKIALVTGAASGIGFACVKELLRNKLKAVALVDIHVNNGERAVSEITKEFGNDCAIFVKADVSDKHQFEEAFETTVKTFKQLDIVINNAGILQEIQWEKCVAVNLTGVITGCMLAMEKYLPRHRNGPEGVILNMASIGGLIPLHEVPTYAATKFGVVALTRSLGGDARYQNTNVRVVAVCPGVVSTSLSEMNENQINEPYLSLALEGIRIFPGQKPETLANNVMDVIKEAPTGSIWLAVSGKKCAQIEFPKYFG